MTPETPAIPAVESTETPAEAAPALRIVEAPEDTTEAEAKAQRQAAIDAAADIIQQIQPSNDIAKKVIALLLVEGDELKKTIGGKVAYLCMLAGVYSAFCTGLEAGIKMGLTDEQLRGFIDLLDASLTKKPEEAPSEEVTP